ncbi:TetR/AcrR family transcriptional regulator [Microbacterium sp. KHB019]|uniref:TetR/AcrR family transcriptional regulator n=1 Tax=Microbacterium sp. KHB019 TaxID=3129770 RepID=UPI003078A66E
MSAERSDEPVAPNPRTLRGRRAIARADDQTAYRDRRREVVDIAARLFREKGYDTTTFADIAREFGTDRASLYYYVTSKQELFEEIVGGILDGNVTEAERILASDDDAPAKLRLLIEDQIETQARNYPHMYVYIQDGMRAVRDRQSEWARRMSAQTSRYERIVRQILLDGVREGSIRSDIDVRLLGAGLFGLMSWTHRWFRPGDPFSPQEVAASIVGIFLESATS